MAEEAISVKVAVRCRPFNGREKERSATLIIEMVGNTTKITNPHDSKTKDFTFDYSYWSHDGFIERPEDGYLEAEPGSPYADQAKVMSELGVGVLENSWNGFHSCVFAYGQTGSGKSYSIVGYGTNKGVIPLTCAEMFRRIEEQTTPDRYFQVEASMMEIYNEKMRDLLDLSKSEKLKIRETKMLGVYVDQLTTVAVKSYKEIERQMEVGTQHRTIGATQMNATSSRAHTVFTITFKQFNNSGGKMVETKSVMNLVDLAGSERAGSTGATGDRLKEGASINSSLTALGQVITALAENSGNGKKKTFVPYRNSVLTRLLQSALGGNSKTLMVAALSPADINYDETLSTLRYADNAKKIKTSAVKNEDPTEKLIRELREENDKLKKAMGGDMSALSGLGGSPEGSSEVAEAAKEAARIAEEEAATAKVEAQQAQAQLATAMARMHELEGLLSSGGGGGAPISVEAIAKVDAAAAEAQAKAAALGNPEEQMAAEGEVLTLTNDIEALAKLHPAHGPAVADAATNLSLLLARGEGGFDFSALEKVKEALLKEIAAEGRVQVENINAALIEAAAEKLTQAHARKSALAATGPNTNEIVALKLVFFQRVQAARREAAAARGLLDEKAALQRNSLESAEVARQIAESALEELTNLKSLSAEQQAELADLKNKSMEEKQALLTELTRKAEEAKAAGDEAKMVDFTRQFNRIAERMKADEKNKLLLAEQMESNDRALKSLETSWDDKLGAAAELEAKRKVVLDKLGLGRLEDNIDEKTPHFVNLNEDPNLAGNLLYFLKVGETLVGSDDACDVVLAGPGIAVKHAKIDISQDSSGDYVVNMSPVGASSTFINGQQITDSQLLRHSDRVIFGARQVYRLVHPGDAKKHKGDTKSADGLAGVIDWDMAQQELGDALGKAINVKVDEEVKREREAMEERIQKMSASLEAEKKAAQEQLDEDRKQLLKTLKEEEGTNSREREAALARKEAELNSIKARADKLEQMQRGLDEHVDSFRAELERVQAELSTLMPAINEANVIADAMGRKIHVAPRVFIEVPETAGLSPAQELMLHKSVALQVVITTSGSEERQKLEIVWTASQFTDRMFAIRDAHYDYLKHNRSPEPGTEDDPFYSPPAPFLIGRAYLSLAPLTHRLRAQHWLTVLDPLGKPKGELLCALQPTEEDFVTPAGPILEAGGLVGTPLNLVLRVQQARGLPEGQNNNVFCKYTLDMEERTTDVCNHKTSAPVFDFRDDLLFPFVSPDMVEYFRSDFLTFEVWGEPDQVSEGFVTSEPSTAAAKAAVNPFDAQGLPPEVFDFFVSLDIHENSTLERSERFEAVQYDGGANPYGITKGVYTLKQGRNRRLLIKLAQGQAQKYPVERCVRVWVSKVEDINGNEVSNQQVPLSVLSTASLPDGSSATIVANWFSGPSVLDELTAEGNALTVTLTIEVELQNLELAAPVKLTKKAAMRIEDGEKGAKSKMSSVAEAPKKKFSLFGGSTPAPPVEIVKGTEEKEASLDPDKRRSMLQRQDTHHPVFMGSWERTDEAVVAQREDMLRIMKTELDAEEGAASVVKQLHDGLARLQEALQAEEQKQVPRIQTMLKLHTSYA